MAKAPKKRGCIGCGWWLEIPTAILLLILLAAMSMPNVQRVRPKAKEAQVKAGLHTIQLALEQYAVDTGGTYPAYLIGGEGKHSVFVEDSADAFISVEDCPDRNLLSDPLLRAGYLNAYPKNPFATNGAAIQRYQEDQGDPLRNATTEGKIHGTRFGKYCNLMGNVLADFRYTEFTVFGDDGAESVFPTHADVEYPFFDMWKTNFPKPFLPGEFFYRSRSVPAFINGEYGQQLITDAVQDYMLGGYGSIRTKGRDIFGPDPTGVNIVSPFGVEGAKGNPNGIRDSIILVLVPMNVTKGPRD